MGKSSADVAATMVANLEAKTGKSLAQWTAVARRSGLEKHAQIVKFLKSEHGLTHGYANMIALKARDAADSGASEADLVDQQYAGARSGLRSTYDSIVAAVRVFGDDVEIAPKKSYVSLRRRKQFALVQPSTASRIDVGINLKGVAPSGRLEKSGSFNSMVSHRVRVTDPAEVDEELIDWLRAAYDAA